MRLVESNETHCMYKEKMKLVMKGKKKRKKKMYEKRVFFRVTHGKRRRRLHVSEICSLASS